MHFIRITRIAGGRAGQTLPPSMPPFKAPRTPTAPGEANAAAHTARPAHPARPAWDDLRHPWHSPPAGYYTF